MNLARAIPLTLAASMLVAACAVPGQDPVERPTPHSTNTVALAAGLNDAGYQMFHAAVANSDDDVVLSPLSIGLAFGMLDVGATDGLAERLKELFGYPVDGEARWSAFNALEQSLAQEGEPATEDVPTSPTVRIANRAYQDADFEPVEGYNELIEKWFGSGIETLPLQRDPEGSRQRINTWVAERTVDLIPELLPPDSITAETVMVLVNTLYMKAAWQTPFDDFATNDADFTFVDGTTASVPLMNNSSLWADSYVGEGYSAIDLPYYGDDISMLVIAPDAGNYSTIEAQLSSEFVASIDGQLTGQLVDFYLPRFESTSDLNLREVIEGQLGMSGVFEVRQLGGIHPDAYVSAAIHSAKIVVDEEGTEAAAATAIGVEAGSAEPDDTLTIRVDDPFLYLIRDHETGAVLFVGRVLDPRA